MNTSNFHKVKDLWQPTSSQAAITSTERPRASSTGRIRATRKGSSIVQDIYDRLGIKREDLLTSTTSKYFKQGDETMIQRTSSLDDSGYVLKKVLDAQDANVADQPQQPQEPQPQNVFQRRPSAVHSRWPPPKQQSEPALVPPLTPPRKHASQRTITIPSSPPAHRRGPVSGTTTTNGVVTNVVLNSTTEPNSSSSTSETLPVMPFSGGGKTSLFSVHTLSPALRKRLQRRGQTTGETEVGPEDDAAREPPAVVVKAPITKPSQTMIATDCWTEEEKKEDDVTLSIKDRLRAYTSTTTSRQIAAYRERPPLIDIYSGSVTSEMPERPTETPVASSALVDAIPTSHNRSNSVANAFLAAIQTNPSQQRSYILPEAIVQSDTNSETESVSMLSSTSDPPGEPSPKSARCNPTVTMHKKIQWLEHRAATSVVVAPRGTTAHNNSTKPIEIGGNNNMKQLAAEKGVVTTRLPNDLERLVDERVKIKVAEAERKLEERLRNYVHELHSRRSLS